MTDKPFIPEKDAIRESAVMEKRHWVRLTKACNNRCLFCLDTDVQDGTILDDEEIRAEIRRGAEDGGERLILSGGEASIHPKFLEFIRFGYETGFNRVQTITNGRMYSYKKFADATIEAGLTEATFSMHGHTPELHDYLTGVPGSFEQATRGMRNLIGRCVVNVDIVINKQNVRFVPDIMRFFMDEFGIHEFDLLHIVPFGRSYPENKELLFYNIAENIERLKEAFSFARLPNHYIWTNRFPVNYLEGNEDLIQDPHKLYDEVNGRREMFGEFAAGGAHLPCFGERCRLCFIEKFCAVLLDTRNRLGTLDFDGAAVDTARYSPVDNVDICNFKRLWITAAGTADLNSFLEKHAGSVRGVTVRLADYREFDPTGIPGLDMVILSNAADCEKFDFADAEFRLMIYLNNSTAGWIMENMSKIAAAKRPVLIALENREMLSDAAAADVDARAFFADTSLDNVELYDLPFCIAPGLPRVRAAVMLDISILNSAGKLDVTDFTRYYIINEYYSKSIRCSECARNADCRGLHINYLRNFGFAQQQPLKE